MARLLKFKATPRKHVYKYDDGTIIIVKLLSKGNRGFYINNILHYVLAYDEIIVLENYGRF